MDKQAEEIKTKSKELLRQQVRDFIKWLKALFPLTIADNNINYCRYIAVK